MRPTLLCRYIPAALLVGLALTGTAQEKPAAPSAQALQFFESKVRPILVENCQKCHGADKQKGGLRLDSRAAIVAGGDQGPAIVVGQPEKSLVIKAIGHGDANLKMPPSKKLPREQIADLTQWVKSGAPWPNTDSTATVAPRKGDKVITDKDRAHWAFQPVKRPAVPTPPSPPLEKGGKGGWVANPIDAFILARLEAGGLSPGPPAPKRELVRRLYYSVTGLPPTPAEVEAFENDNAPNAYEKLVERLLESPRYGEKWGRHWLDLVRYAETNSYERDNPKPNAWRYRDYVIRAFNQDKPYDRFIHEQLAGDELTGASGASAPDADSIIATGFYRLGIWDDEPTDRTQAFYDGLDDIITTTGQVFLGLTIDCARCHDHKIDPIQQKDYYRLQAFFHNINHFRNGGPTDESPIFAQPGSKEAYEKQVRALELRRNELQTAVTAFEDEFKKLHEQVNGKPVPQAELGKVIGKEGAALLGKERFARYQEQRKELDAARKQKIAGEFALCISEAGSKGPETFVHIRGNANVKGERVEPGFPAVFGLPAPAIPSPPPGAKSSGRRLVLAQWLTANDNPLTARVMVNRIWQQHFGRGLVRSPNNFGTQGDRPTHPELLDWLAAEFMNAERGTRNAESKTAEVIPHSAFRTPHSGAWSIKRLHRLILTSNTYRMSSRANPQALSADPANNLFWRFDPRRLSGEEIRDSILAVSGNLNLKMFGPGIYVDIPKEVLAGQSNPGYGWGKSSPEEQGRRSVYIHVKRSLLTPILESFDLAETDRTAPVRFTSTQSTQALGMLNSEFLNKQAGIFAERLRKEAGTDLRQQVRLAFYLATQRAPTDKETQRGVDLIETLKKKEGLAAELALKYFCLMVLNLNEFVYVD